jgi:hypothetical protein
MEKNCIYDIVNNSFNNNTASSNGGAISYNLRPPNDLYSNTLSNNNAQYGNDNSSYGV